MRTKLTSRAHLSPPAPMAAGATSCCSPGLGVRRRWCRTRSDPSLATFFANTRGGGQRAGFPGWLPLVVLLGCFQLQQTMWTAPQSPSPSAHRNQEKLEKRSKPRALFAALRPQHLEDGSSVLMGGVRRIGALVPRRVTRTKKKCERAKHLEAAYNTE